MNTTITIHHVCSLGAHCISSQLCKETKLKTESYPFDWIFSEPNLVIQIMKDNFSLFLNKQYYKPISSTKCTHALYGTSLFNHHNPKDNNEHYNYFIRCVNRFQKLIKLETSKLFIVTFINIRNTDEDIENCKKQVVTLKEYLDTEISNYHLFVMCIVPCQSTYSTNITDIDNIKFVTVYTKSSSDGVKLKDAKEDKMLQQLLLNNYTFKIKCLEETAA